MTAAGGPENRPRADRDHHIRREHPTGVESPRNLLAFDDPSRRRTARSGQATGRWHGVTVEWLRPTELAARITTRTAARAVEAAGRRRARIRPQAISTAARTTTARRGRLAPASAFGRHAAADAPLAEHTVVGR